MSQGDDGGGDHWKAPKEPSNAWPYDPIGAVPPPAGG